MTTHLHRQQSRRWWRRLERRAIAGYERDLLAELRRLACESSEIEALEIHPTPAADVLRLRVAGGLLSISGVLDSTLATVSDAAGPLQIVDAGRYGRVWWVTVAGDGLETVIGGARLRLTPFDGGLGRHRNQGCHSPQMTL